MDTETTPVTCKPSSKALSKSLESRGVNAPQSSTSPKKLFYKDKQLSTDGTSYYDDILLEFAKGQRSTWVTVEYEPSETGQGPGHLEVDGKKLEYEPFTKSFEISLDGDEGVCTVTHEGHDPTIYVKRKKGT